MTTAKPKLPMHKLRIALELFLKECPSVNAQEKLVLRLFVEWCEKRNEQT